MSLRIATILSLATFVLVALGAVYILGRPWQHGWGLDVGYLSWKDRLLYAGGLVTLSGALVALVVNYRKQLAAEAGQFTAGFADAARQLGDQAPAVRIAGVYALATLADRHPGRRQQCIDALCGYLRLPYHPEAGAGHLAERSTETTDTKTHVKTIDRRSYRADDREVRLTIIRTIRDHLRPHAAVSWQGHDLDFTGATFDGGDFTQAVFSGGTVNFEGAEFSAGTVNFEGAEFSGGAVNFRRAEFSGGTVDFRRAEFSGGTVDFWVAVFSGGTVNFAEAKFFAGTVNFRWAKFSGGTVNLVAAEFSGGTVHFGVAKFSGGTVNFGWAEFSGGAVDFERAEFSGGTVHFEEAVLAGGEVRAEREQLAVLAPTLANITWAGGRLNVGGAVVTSEEELRRLLPSTQ